MTLVAKRGQRGGLGNIVDIERLTDAVKQIGQIGMGQAVAHTQPCQPECLGESPGHKKVRVAGEIGLPVGILGRLDVVEIRLVEHHRHMGRHAVEKPLQLGGGIPGAGGVVGIGDENNRGIIVELPGHGLEIMAIGPWMPRREGPRHLDLSAGDARDQLVDGEGMGGNHRIAARTQKDPGNQLQELVGPVAQRHLYGHHPVLACQSRLELEAVAIRILGNRRQDPPRRLERPRRGADGALVGGHLDHVLDAIFALQLGYGLAGLIGGKAAYRRMGSIE